MIEIKSLQEKLSALHEATAQFAENVSTPEAQAELDAKFAEMDGIQKQIDNAHKLAAYKLAAGEVVKPVASAAQKAYEASEARGQVARFATAENIDHAQFAASLSEWFNTGQMDAQFATITTATGSGVMLPKYVGAPITPVRSNVYRKAMELFGVQAETYGHTAVQVSPVISSSSGGAFGEDEDEDIDGAPSVGNITTTPGGYHSGTYWFSGLQTNAVGWDITVSTLPALKSAKDYGLAKAISAAVIADSGIPNQATASISTLTLDNLDDAIAQLPAIYENKVAIVLQSAAYNVLDKLKDTTGVPILTRNDVQGLSFRSYKGHPVLKDDTLENFGANKVVGLVISFDGFVLRDEIEKLKRYENDPDRVDKTGLDYIGYHGFGWIDTAMVKLKCPAS